MLPKDSTYYTLELDFASPGERRAGAGPDARGHGAVLCPGQVGQPTISAAEGRREQDGVRREAMVLYFVWLL